LDTRTNYTAIFSGSSWTKYVFMYSVCIQFSGSVLVAQMLYKFSSQDVCDPEFISLYRLLDQELIVTENHTC
jgi:hypothetical protein